VILGFNGEELIDAKIVYIGAGSHQFARRLITDILYYPELRGNTITLMDIAKEPLDLITLSPGNWWNSRSLARG